MRVLSPDDNGIAQALTILRQGGVVAHATETCYGFACDLSNKDAVQKLFSIKNRPADQPVSGLFENIEHAQEFVEWNARAEELANEHLPGPLTLILPLKKNPPFFLYPTPRGGNSLGIRISSYPLAETIVKLFGKPITTTSANLHGKENPYSAEDILTQYKEAAVQPDVILDSGVLPKNPPSTVINLVSPDEQIHRKGSVKPSKQTL
ncbi:threonylcarbamoyl-AMP synthase [Candidatus Peregrinibacteria bacterium]|nr:threonylcarbamoyl-AMP synthase [Candidatus Peregrinibacteria bacterium]